MSNKEINNYKKYYKFTDQTTDKNTATCMLNEYLKKTYGQDVLEYIGYKGDIGKTRLTALIQTNRTSYQREIW